MKVRTLSHLTTLRLGASDVPERLKDLDPDGMRVEPLGEDSDGVVFWYFYGVRLYKEVKAGKPKKPRKKKKEEKPTDETGDQGNSKQTRDARGSIFLLRGGAGRGRRYFFRGGAFGMRVSS